MTTYLFRLLLVVFSAVLPTFVGTLQAERQVTIGIISPLSGRVGIIGETIQKALEVYSEKPENQAVRFLFEDDQFTPRLGLAAAQKLVNVDRVDAVIIFGSGSTLASADFLEKKQIPTLAIAFSDKLVANRKYIYRATSTAATQATLIAEELRKRKTSYGIITSTVEATVAVRDAFMKTDAPRPVFEFEIDPAESDMNGIATKVIAAKTEALFLLLMPPQNAVLSKLLRSRGWKGQFFSSSQLNNPGEIAASQGALRGAWVTTIAHPAARELMRELEERKGSAAALDGTLVYDCADFLVRALKSKDPLHFLSAHETLEGLFGVWRKVSYHTFEPQLGIITLE